MKKYIDPPKLSTAFSPGGRTARQRLENILNMNVRRIGLVIIAVLLLSAVTAGACVSLGTTTDFFTEAYSALLQVSEEEFEANAVVRRSLSEKKDPDGVEKLDEFLAAAAAGEPAEIDLLDKSFSTTTITLTRLRYDGEKYRAVKLTRYRDGTMSSHFIGPYEHLKIMYSAIDDETIVLLNDETITSIDLMMQSFAKIGALMDYGIDSEEYRAAEANNYDVALLLSIYNSGRYETESVY